MGRTLNDFGASNVDGKDEENESRTVDEDLELNSLIINHYIRFIFMFYYYSVLILWHACLFCKYKIFLVLHRG